MGFFNFRSTPEKKNESETLKRVHLIVHPGDGIGITDDAKEKALLSAMTARASSIGIRDEIAVVLLRASAEELADIMDPNFDGKKGMLGAAIRSLELALPSNVIVVANAGSVYFPMINRVFGEIKTKMAEIGFAIDTDTKILAYGETARQCVPTAAAGFARYFDLRSDPTVELALTDAALSKKLDGWKAGGPFLNEARRLDPTNVDFIPIPRDQEPL